MAADSRYAAAFDGSAIDGHVLANFVVIANIEPRGLALVGDILRRHADGAIGKKGITRADFRRTFYGHMRKEPAILAQLNVGPNNTIRTHLARRRNLRLGINDRRGMYVR